MFYCYILQSKQRGRYYIGSTNDISKRIAQHNSGNSKSTTAFQPWKLIYYELYKTRPEATAREKQIKSWKKRSNIEKLILRNKIEDPR